MKLAKNMRYILGILVILIFCTGAYYIWGPDQAAPAPIIDGKPGYDVIVVGGEPEGVAAALAAARNGLKTLLIEDDEALGGLMTLGELNFLDMNYGPNNELLTRGIFEEFNKDLGNAFDIEEAKSWFLMKTENEKNITLKLNVASVEPILREKEIVGVRLEENGSSQEYLGLRIIDATIDADIAAAAGVPYTIGGEDYGEKGLLMGVTLVFEVAGVDWDGVVQYLKHEDTDPHSSAGKVAAWGYGKEAMEYQSEDGNMRFRGPNMARQKNGNILINALLIFGVDSLDPQSKAEGIRRGKEEIPHIIEFMRDKFSGFEKAEYASAAEQLYVRETRHIQGEYRLTITDVLENKDHWDRIAHGSYPVDVQPTSPDNYGNIIGVPDIYSIPFRCLVPLEIENLLVVGRSASYDSLPHGSARVIPIGMATGEAAGVASAYSLKNEISFREMTASEEAVVWVQQQLTKQGAYLVEYSPPHVAIMDHWAYPGVKIMRELGLIEGGYNNDYRLEREANKWSIQNKFNKVIRVAHEKNPVVELRIVELPEVLTEQDLIIAAVEGISGEKLSFEKALKVLQEKQILTAELEEHITSWEQVPQFAEMLMLSANMYEYLLKR
ncbi:MAG: thiamine biosynthesis protein [Firmicutes bacterium HGW-Firmicutes-12]|nr:MAG: thiamine biosynthesis protein [Firmicutes bacterium HGW-Firmicutes-12]